jgi:hypothetical protein
MSRSGTQPGQIRTSILLGAGFFIFALFLSAVFDRTIRVLHALQALIYVAVILLTRRSNSWGFGAGCIPRGRSVFLCGGWSTFMAPPASAIAA